MVSHCSNPQCKVAFQSLHVADLDAAGDLYALERRGMDTEFFWLCPACTPNFVLSLDPAGELATCPRSPAPHHLPPNPEHSLRLVTRHRTPIYHFHWDDPSDLSPA